MVAARLSAMTDAEISFELARLELEQRLAVMGDAVDRLEQVRLKLLEEQQRRANSS